MKVFVKIPTILEDTKNEALGMGSERLPTETYIDILKVVAFTETIPDDNDGRHAILVYCEGIQPFYSPMSIKEFKNLLDKSLGINDLKI